MNRDNRDSEVLRGFEQDTTSFDVIWICLAIVGSWGFHRCHMAVWQKDSFAARQMLGNTARHDYRFERKRTACPTQSLVHARY